MSLKITNGTDTINIKEQFCLNLEYEVNKFGRKDNWISIGNHLYYFVCPDMSHPKSSDTLNVNNNEFNILRDIINNNKFF